MDAEHRAPLAAYVGLALAGALMLGQSLPADRSGARPGEGPTSSRSGAPASPDGTHGSDGPGSGLTPTGGLPDPQSSPAAPKQIGVTPVVTVVDGPAGDAVTGPDGSYVGDDVPARGEPGRDASNGPTVGPTDEASATPATPVPGPSPGPTPDATPDAAPAEATPVTGEGPGKKPGDKPSTKPSTKPSKDPDKAPGAGGRGKPADGSGGTAPTHKPATTSAG